MKAVVMAEFDKAIANLEQMSRDDALTDVLLDAARSCCDALRSGGKIMFAGNGGSAADAQHWAAELVSRFNYDRPGLAAIALTTDTSALTAIGNDYGYEYSFSRQVEAVGRRGDVLIAISTSGNSPNVLKAVEAARSAGIMVIGFTGAEGGALSSGCDLCFQIPSTETPRIQEGHEFLGHMLCQLIETDMFPRP